MSDGTHSKANKISPKRKKLRGCLHELLILGGVFILAGAGMVFTRGVLAADQITTRTYLISTTDFELALPQGATAMHSIEKEPSPVANLPAKTGIPAIGESALIETDTSAPAGDGLLPQATSTPTSSITPTPSPAAGRIVRLVIPRLKVDRAVMTIAPQVAPNGRLSWNTDILFSTANRSDLVGQPMTSVNPGDGGNIILLGHNYNQGWGNWEGVFVNLSSLKPGDMIQVGTEHGGVFQYVVERVKKVPWQKQNSAELEKHQKYLLPTAREQLTLVTCGGANLWTWSARIYVVAIPY